MTLGMKRREVFPESLMREWGEGGDSQVLALGDQGV